MLICATKLPISETSYGAHPTTERDIFGPAKGQQMDKSTSPEAAVPQRRSQRK